MKNKANEKQITKYIFLIAGLVLGILYFSYILNAVGLLWRIVYPLILGFVIAYVLNIPMKKIESLYFPRSKSKLVKKSRRAVSLLLSVALILLVLLLVLLIVLPEIGKTFAVLASAFPGFIDRINSWIQENKQHVPAIADWISEIKIDWQSLVRSVANYTTKGISSIFNSSINLISVFTSGIFDLLMSLAFAIYLLSGKETLLAQLKRVQQAFMQERVSLKLNQYLAVANESFTNFISGQCIEALVLGSLCSAGMWIFRFPHFMTVGVFIGVTALIPVVGAYLGAGVGVFLILMVDPLKAIWFLVFICILQQLENNLIYPRIVGTSIGLPGIWVLITVVIGGGLGGVIGMLLSVPVAATLYKLLQMATRERLALQSKVSKEGSTKHENH